MCVGVHTGVNGRVAPRHGVGYRAAGEVVWESWTIWWSETRWWVWSRDRD